MSEEPNKGICEPMDMLLMSNPPQYCCKKCRQTWYAKDETPICAVSSEVLSWAVEFREYFDKTLKPKKPTMGNLDRELCIDFIKKVEAAAVARGRDQQKKEMMWYEDRLEETRNAWKQDGKKEAVERAIRALEGEIRDITKEIDASWHEHQKLDIAGQITMFNEGIKKAIKFLSDLT